MRCTLRKGLAFSEIHRIEKVPEASRKGYNP